MGWKDKFLVAHRQVCLTRTRHGHTQASAGLVAGVSERTYRDFESGTGDLNTARFFKLCHELGLEITIKEGVLENGAD